MRRHPRCAVDHHPIAAAALGRVERGIGAFEQRLFRLAVADAPASDPDAYGDDRQIVPAIIVRAFEARDRVPDALGRGCGDRFIDVRQQKDEFLATEVFAWLLGLS